MIMRAIYLLRASTRNPGCRLTNGVPGGGGGLIQEEPPLGEMKPAWPQGWCLPGGA
jgi:hypothetical protein